jgi:hypothetical protein
MHGMEAIRNPNRGTIHLARCPSLRINDVETSNWERISLSSPNGLMCPYCIDLYEAAAAGPGSSGDPFPWDEMFRTVRVIWPDLVAAVRAVRTGAPMVHAMWQSWQRRTSGSSRAMPAAPREPTARGVRQERAGKSAFAERARHSRRVRRETESRQRGHSH